MPPTSTDSLRIVRPGRHAANDAFAPAASPAGGTSRPPGGRETLIARLPFQNPERAAEAIGPDSRRWGPSDFERGDQVRYLSVWYEVLGVGPLGLTVRFRRSRDGSAWDVPAEYTKVTGRRRDGVEDVDAA
jgi:hypothetical protein